MLILPWRVRRKNRCINRLQMTGNSKKMEENIFFRFEEDFVEPGIRCIPMIVRFKLDACGIKLKLAEWSSMSAAERMDLATAPCVTPDEVAGYRETLCALISNRTGVQATEIPVPENPPWSQTDVIPPAVQQQALETGYHLSVGQWQRLSALQRFALVKLSSPGHENKNFGRAVAEFGAKSRRE